MDDLNEIAENLSGTRTVAFGADEHAFVLRVARRLVTGADAYDVAQDAMLTAFRYRHAFRGESAPRTWLYRIAVTAALSHLRRARREANRNRQIPSTAIAEAVLAQAPLAPDDAMASSQVVQRVQSALHKLDVPYREVMRLRCADYSEQEVARALGISPATAKIRAHRARKMMHAELAA